MGVFNNYSSDVNKNNRINPNFQLNRCSQVTLQFTMKPGSLTQWQQSVLLRAFFFFFFFLLRAFNKIPHAKRTLTHNNWFLSAGDQEHQDDGRSCTGREMSHGSQSELVCCVWWKGEGHRLRLLWQQIMLFMRVLPPWLNSSQSHPEGCEFQSGGAQSSDHSEDNIALLSLSYCSGIQLKMCPIPSCGGIFV